MSAVPASVPLAASPGLPSQAQLEAMTSLPAIPPPGVALFPRYLVPETTQIILKKNTFNSTLHANSPGGQEIFHIENEIFSMSHRRTVTDAQTSQKLFQVRCDNFSTKYYYAEAMEGGPKLFQTITHVHLMHRDNTTVKFNNQADPTRPELAMEYIPSMMGKLGSLSLNGQVVVKIERNSLTISGEHHLTIAPGLDPALVVGIVVAMLDRADTQAFAISA